MRKNMPDGRTSYPLHIPRHQNIAILFISRYSVAKKPPRRGQQSVVARIVAMTHIDEHPPLRRQQTSELAENLHAGRLGENVPEYIPETSDDIKPALHRVKILGPHGQHASVGWLVSLHGPARLEQHEFLNATRLRDAAGPGSIASPNIQQRAATGGHLRDNQPVDASEIRLALARDPPEDGRDAVVSRDRISRAGDAQNVNRAII
jgi:hypothetical protein